MGEGGHKKTRREGVRRGRGEWGGGVAEGGGHDQVPSRVS